MAVTDVAEWRAGLDENCVRQPWIVASASTSILGSQLVCPATWANRNGTPATPSTAVALGASSDIAMIPPPPASDYWIGAIECGIGNGGNRMSAGGMLIDILSIQGGLSGTTTGAQTTNLPTAALTRYTDGEGVMMAALIWSSVGSTATTLRLGYTNQAGTTSRTSKEIVFGSSVANAGARFLIAPTQDGDTGARAIASAEILATTGTAGSFGVCLFKPLAILPAQSPIITQREPYRNYLEGAASMSPDSDACLAVVLFGPGGGSAAAMIGGSIVYIPG